MYISKNESIEKLTKRLSQDECSKELLDHNLIVAQCKDPSCYGVYQILRDENNLIKDFPYKAYFSDLKSAIKHAEDMENPRMIDQGYTMIKLHNDLSIVMYYDLYKSSQDEKGFNINKFIKGIGYTFSGKEYPLGDTGVIVRLAEKGRFQNKSFNNEELLKEIHELVNTSGLWSTEKWYSIDAQLRNELGIEIDKNIFEEDHLNDKFPKN